MQRQLALPGLALLLLAAQLPLCAAFWGSSPSPSPPLSLNKAFDYCIVGAGPGGLQLGHYMHQQSRDYVIFERQPIPCPFFARFPIHRQLISLNKRFTGRDNEEFNMRHDWNSLLDTDVVPVTKRVKERFPDADVLVDYMADFARPQSRAGHISYNTDVKNIDRDGDDDPFTVTVQRSAHVEGETWYYRDVDVGTDPGPQVKVQCKRVIMANGLWVPNKMPLEGIDLATGYEELPSTGESFEDKAVTVLGMGNAALETANAVADYAQYVHIWPTRDGGPAWPHTSWESRYVGSARAIRMGPVDGYLLKSLDGLPLGDVVVASPSRMVIRKCMGGKKCLLHKSDRRKGPGGETMIDLCGGACPVEDVAEFERDPVSDDLYYEKQPGEAFGMTMLTRMDGETADDYKLRNYGEIIYVALSNITESNIDRLFSLKQQQSGTLSKPYDTVVRAMGWKHNTSVYGAGATPLLQSQQKYPRMTHEYESVNVPGMYFCGTLAHGKDFKRAAGGFIHGFRYTARALHRILELKYEARPWPSQEFTLPGQAEELGLHILNRQNSASAPYQMFYTLGDAMIYEKGDGNDWVVKFMQDVPVDYLNIKFKDSHRMWWTFGFNGQRRTLSESILEGTGFEPWIWYWKPGVSKAGGRYREVFRSVENLHTDWSHKFILDNVIRWIRTRLGYLQDAKGKESVAAWKKDQNTNVTHLGDFRAVEIDMVIANHLDVPLTILRGDEILTTIAGDSVLPKLTSFDGQPWTVQYKLPSGQNVVRSWELRFENGIFQEIHIDTDFQPFDSMIFDDTTPVQTKGARGGDTKSKPASLPYSHATFLATHTDQFCDLMAPGILDALSLRGHDFGSFEEVKARLPNNAAWVNLFEQVVGQIAAQAGMDTKEWEKDHMADAVTILQSHYMDAISAAANAATEALLPALVGRGGGGGGAGSAPGAAAKSAPKAGPKRRKKRTG